MLSGSYVIDWNVVLQKLYGLICLFFANNESARRTDAEDPSEPLRRLETMFFVTEVSRFLIEFAVAFRVIDDQMKRLPQASRERIEHKRRCLSVRQYQYALFDDLRFDLRQACNKTLHSYVMEPSTTDGNEPHAHDLAYLHEDGHPRSIDWRHFDGYVTLAGTDRSEEWYVLLNVEVFARAVTEVLGPDDCFHRAAARDGFTA